MLRKLILFSVLGAISAVDKVPVSVYYESLCPDSIAFVTEQLVPTYNTLKNHMDVNLVPYGKASHRRNPDSWTFKCHHGPVECYGNKVQGCVLKQIHNRDDQMKYINCLMNQSRTIKNEYPVGGCISGVDLGVVTTCANRTEGDPNGADILAANGDETNRLKPPLTSVPTVVFNGVFNATEQGKAQENLKEVVCSYLKEKCLPECNSAAAAATTSVSVLVAVATVFVFLL